MKTLLIVAMLFTVGCGKSDLEEGSATPSSESSGSGDATATIEKKEACEQVDDQTIVEIMGWSASNLKKEQMMSLKDRDITVCNYLHGDDKLLIRLAWKSEKSEENKVLEKNFKRFLNEGENELSYKEISSTADSQTIFGTGKGRGGQTQYILRKRFGNSVDVQIESVALESNVKEFSKKLSVLLGKLQA